MDRAFARVSILFTCLYGLVFLWLRERTGSLIFPILAHNLVNVVLTTPWPFLNICGWAVVPGWSDTTRRLTRLNDRLPASPAIGSERFRRRLSESCKA